MNSQDFTKGVDFTGINPATGGDHNNLIELAVPTDDGADSKGKSLNLVTDDSAVDTPDVPDATVTTKWKRYQWVRRPHADDTFRKCRLYHWDDNATSNATFLKWIEISANSEEMADLTSNVNNALSTSQDAVATADAAANTANTANTKSDAAVATSNAANATATAANTTANTANTTANNANATATAANTTATQAVNFALTADVDLTRILVADTVGKIPAVDSSGTRLELISRSEDIAIFLDSFASGSDGGDAVTGVNDRVLNYEYKSAPSWATLNGGGTISLVAGKYLIEAWATGYAINHQAQLYDVGSAAVINYGTSIYGTAVNINTVSHVTAYIDEADAREIRLRTVANANVSKGLGRASGLAVLESFIYFKVTRIG